MTGYLKNNFRNSIVAGFLFSVCSLSATSIYVSTNGSDGNNGLTLGTAKASISGALAVSGVTEIVLDGNEFEHCTITKPVTIRSNDPDNPALFKRNYSLANSEKIMTVAANDVTVKDIKFELISDFPVVDPAPLYACVYADGRNNLTVDNCEFLISYGTRGKGIEFVAPGTLPTVPNHKITVTNCKFTVNPDTPDDTQLRYWHGIRVFGADLTLTGSTFHGAYRDVEIQQSSAFVENNTFHSSVNISNPYGPNTINNNEFVCTPHGGADWLAPDEAAVTIRAGNGTVGPFPLIISENTISGFPVGIWSGASRNVKILNNEITGATLGLPAGALIRIDSKPTTSASAGPSNNDVEIKGNTLIAATPANTANHVALEFVDNDTVNPYLTYTAVVGGDGDDANNFQGSFDQIVKNSVNVDFDLSKNKFDVGSGLKTPADLTVAELFALEDKITHKLDNSTAGFVRVKADSVFATTNNDGIQAAVNAAEAGDTVYVQNGTYAENVNINKTLTLEAQSDAVVITETAAPGNQLLFTAAADDITIRNFTFNAGSKTAAAIFANNRQNMLVEDNKFVLVGFGGKLDGTPAAGLVGSNGWSAKGILVVGPTAAGFADRTATIQGNAFSSTVPPNEQGKDNYFQFAVQAFYANVVIGGDDASDANTFAGVYRDAQIEYSGARIVNNSLASNINLLHPQGDATEISGNTFDSGDVTWPNGEAYITIRGNWEYASNAINIENNIFRKTVRGVWAGQAKNVSVIGNEFEAIADSTAAYAHVLVDSNPVLAVSTSDKNNSITIQDNTFKGTTVAPSADQYAIQFADTSTAAGRTFGPIVIGGAGNENSFEGNFNQFIHFAVAKEKLNTASVDVSGNTYEIPGVTAPLTTPEDYFALEDLLYHNTDNSAFGRLSINPDAQYVVAGGSIQAAIDAASEGNTIYVSDGTYTENVNINKAGIKLVAVGDATITAPTSATNSVVVNVTASDVTVEGFNIDVNRPYATAGVLLKNTTSLDVTNVTVKDNTITLSGSGGNANSFVPFGTASVGISLYKDNGGRDPKITVEGNTVGSESAPFDRAIYTRSSNGLITENTVYGANHDIVVQFVTGAKMTVSKNQLNGWGNDGFKGAQLDITEPNTLVEVVENTFNPQEDTTDYTHVRSLMLKNIAQPASLPLIKDNVFNVRKVGILSANTVTATFEGNTFTPVAGATGFTHLEINNKVPTGGTVAARTMSAVIVKNEFNGPGGTAIALRNHNNHAGALINTLTIGGTDNENTFALNLDQYLELDGQTGGTQASGIPGYASVGNTTMAPFSANVTLGENLLGADSISSADLAELFNAEDKITHKLDNNALGFVRIKPESVFVTVDSASIQNAVNAAEAGDTVYVQNGTYAENVNINKSLTLEAQSDAVVITETAAAGNQLLFTAAADDITIRNFTFNAGGKTGAAIYANNRKNLLVEDNAFTLTGFGGTLVGTPAEGLVTSNGWSAKGILFIGPSIGGYADRTLTVQGNTFSSLVPPNGAGKDNYFQFGVQAFYANVVIGGDDASDANTFAGVYRDAQIEYTAARIVNNNLASNINLLQPAGALTEISGNTFDSGDVTWPNGEAYITIRGNWEYASNAINIENNIFRKTVRGVWAGQAKNVSVIGNEFEAIADSTAAYAHVLVDSNPVLAVSTTDQNNSITIQDNTFKGTTVAPSADQYAIQFADTSTAAGRTFGPIVIGGAGNENSFEGNFNQFIHFAVAKEKLNTASVDVSRNTYEIPGVTAPLTTPEDYFALEDLLYHNADDSAFGRLQLNPNAQYVVAGGSIQDAIDAASAGNTIYVQDGIYAENITIDKPLTLIGESSEGTILTETSAAGNQLLVTVAADDVTINNFGFDAGSKTGAVIFANNRKNLRVEDNDFTLTGFGGSLAGTDASGTAGSNGWSARGILMTAPSLGGFEERTLFVNRNTFSSTVAPNEQGKDNYFQFAIHARHANLSMGSNDILDANVLSGVYRDVQAEYSQVEIVNNNLAANVNLVQPFGTNAIVAGNVFDFGSGVWINDEAYITIRGTNESNATVAITDNTFNKASRAIWSGNAKDVVILDNEFNAIAEAANPFSLILFNSATPTSEVDASASSNAIRLEGNTFNGATGAEGQYAVEFRDTNTNANVSFGPVIIGSAGNPNVFGEGFDQFVKFGVKKEHLDVASVNISFNTFALPGASAPLAVPTDYFALEGKLYHNADDAAFGRLLLLADTQFVSGGSIQAAIDAASAGNTIYVAPGTYVENVNVNKTVTVLGPKAGVAGTGVGRGTDEAVIVPAVNNGGTPAQNAPLTTEATVRLTAKDAIVDGFTVDGDNPGLAGDANSSYGIASVTAEGGVQVLNNIVKNVSVAGVYGKDISPNTNHFAHNLVTDSTIGFMAEHNFFAHIHDNTATEVWRGIYVNNMLQDGGADPMVIENNTLTKNDQTGIYVNQYSSVTPIDVVNNSIDGTVDSTDVVERYGIRLGTIRGNAKVTFDNNTVEGFTHGVVAFYVDSTQAPVIKNGSISNVGIGVKVTTRDTHFPGNNASLKLDGVAVSATETGILVHDSNATGVAGDASSVEIVNGSITGGQDSILIDGPNTSAVVNGVNLVNPTRDYIRLANNAAPTLNLATAQFDGKLIEDMDFADLFDLERKITHKVDDTALGFISFRPEKVFVTSPVVGATDSDITRGVAAAGATSFTVYLEGGLYEGARPTVNEKTTFTLEGASLTTPAVLGEGLTLTGTNTALTLRNLTIGGLQANTTLESVMNNTGTVNGITFDNVTIDGNEVVGRHGVTGGQYGGEILIANSHFKNIIGKPAPSPSGWVAFDTRSGAGTATAGAKITTATLRNNTFTNVQGAINLRHEVSVEPRAEVIIENNIVENSLPAVDNRAGGFFKVFGANRLAFIGNTVSGVKISSPAATDETDAYGAAVLTRNVNHIYVSGNVFENNHQAIAAESVHGIPSGTIADNLFKNNNFGVYYPNVAGWTGPIHVVNNHFIGQTGLSVRAEGSGIAVNAVNNWFGTNDGPTGSNGVSAGVVASPWIGSPDNTESHIITASGETAINFDLMDETVPAGVTFSNDSGFANGEIFSVAVKDGTSPQGYNGFVDNVALPRSLFINVSQATSGFVAVIKLGYVKENLPAGYFQDQLVLSTWNPLTKVWEPAVASNSAGTPQFMGLAPAPEATEANLGKYGVDINESVVWAVVDHASEYAVGVGSDVIESAVVDWSAY